MIMFNKGPLAFHSFLKIIVWETLLKTFFNVNLHHNSIYHVSICFFYWVYVKEGFDAKKDGLTTLRVETFNWWGIGAPETTPKAIEQWNN